MQEMVQALRGLWHSVSEYPAEWPDDLLAEVGNIAAAVKGAAQTEQLFRALNADVLVDERDGHGWQLFERIDLADYGTEG